jgi:hypothetical protein
MKSNRCRCAAASTATTCAPATKATAATRNSIRKFAAEADRVVVGHVGSPVHIEVDAIT